MGPDSRRVERKYVFPSRASGQIRAWLDHAFLPDPRHPGSAVSSIYYDTPSLSLYEEKRDGDFRKHKLRLRWYDETADGFLEVKLKEGALCGKTRLEVRLPVTGVDDLSSPELGDLARLCTSMGFPRAERLVPIALIRYDRRRFVDPASGARVSLDTAIRCTAVNESFVRGHPPVELDAGVLEVKIRRPGSSLPNLDPLHRTLKHVSFSKYAEGLRAVFAPRTRSQ
jgi:hypothetical protein